MARDVKVGITITARDAAAAALTGISTAAKNATSSVERMATNGMRAFTQMHGSIIAVNQAFELGGKIARVFTMTIGKAWELAREASTATGQYVDGFKRMDEASSKFSLQIGRILAPAVDMVNNAMASLVKTLTGLLTPAWQQAADDAQRFAEFNAKIAEDAQVVVDYAAKEAAAIQTRLWNIKKLREIEQSDQDEKLRRARERMEMAEFEQAITDDISASIAATQKHNMEQVAAADAIIQRNMTETMEANAERRIATTNDVADSQKQALLELAATAQSVASTLVSSFSNAFSGVLDGTKSVGEAFTDMFMNLGKMILQQLAVFVIAEGIKQAAIALTAATQVGAHATVAASSIATGTTQIAVAASVGAANAMEAHSKIPFVGIAIGLAMAAAIVGSIYAAKKFAGGGMVTGGTPGKDSVPALLMPGELVVPARETAVIRRLMGQGGSSDGRMAEGGIVRGGGASGRSITVNINSTLPMDGSALKRQLRDIGPHLRALARAS